MPLDASIQQMKPPPVEVLSVEGWAKALEFLQAGDRIALTVHARPSLPDGRSLAYEGFPEWFVVKDVVGVAIRITANLAGDLINVYEHQIQAIGSVYPLHRFLRRPLRDYTRSPIPVGSKVRCLPPDRDATDAELVAAVVRQRGWTVEAGVDVHDVWLSCEGFGRTIAEAHLERVRDDEVFEMAPAVEVDLPFTISQEHAAQLARVAGLPESAFAVDDAHLGVPRINFEPLPFDCEPDRAKNFGPDETLPLDGVVSGLQPALTYADALAGILARLTWMAQDCNKDECFEAALATQVAIGAIDSLRDKIGESMDLDSGYGGPR